MKKCVSLFVCLLIALTVPFSAFASVVQPNDLFYVYDGAGVLSGDTEATIVLNNDALYEACGAQIVIATIKSSGSMQLGDYAYELFNDWGIGSAEKNNGVLILMEIGAEDYWYMQGSGIERSLSTGDLAELVDRYLEPDFADADYDEGAEKLFKQLFERVADIYGVNVKYRAYDEGDLYSQADTGRAADVRAPKESKGGAAPLLLIAVVLLCIILPISSRRRRRSAPTVVVTPPPVVPVPPKPRTRVIVRRPTRVILRPAPPRRRHNPGPFGGPGHMGPGHMGPGGFSSRPASRPSSFSSSARRSGGFGSASRSGGGRSSIGGGRSGGFSGGSRGGGGGGSRGGGGGRGR